MVLNYSIRSDISPWCPLTSPPDSTTAEPPVTEYHCDSGDRDNQLWWFDKRPGGTCWIRNQKSDDMGLDVSRTDKKGPGRQTHALHVLRPRRPPVALREEVSRRRPRDPVRVNRSPCRFVVGGDARG
ncbi:RICIN domain-containing protein [Streptomyces violaceusniger]|uniref:RICIN domain-containing protein n=1 Tax=Streptomyces violaceusniger TaxID=68280 RepID=UPI0034188407